MKKKRTGIIFSVSLLFLLMLILSGCGRNAQQETQETAPDGRPKIQVITTIFPPFDFVRRIGGEYVEVSMLLKPGMEAHSYEPSPRDIIRITESGLFLYAGGESDVWVEELLEGNDGEVYSHSLLSWVEPLEEESLEGMQVRGHDHGEHAEEDGVHLEQGEYDEHVWTSPANAILLVEKIRDTLILLDPERKDVFMKNAEDYLAELRQLDQDYRKMTVNAKRHTLVFGDRFPFLYLVKNYGLSYYAAFPGCSSETEPSAATIAFLTDEVEHDQIPVIFRLEMSNGKVAEAIAEVTGTKTAVLHSCHTLTREEMERGETYLSLMRQNLEQLDKALNE